jgi:hypothetical protein
METSDLGVVWGWLRRRTPGRDGFCLEAIGRFAAAAWARGAQPPDPAPTAATAVPDPASGGPVRRPIRFCRRARAHQ